MRAPSENIEPRLRLIRSAILLALIVVAGIVGFKVIGGDRHSWLDAVYMTAVTLTTVGYGEIIEVSSTPAGKVFTTMLLFGGVGTFLYFFSSATAFLVGGTLDHVFWRRKMSKTLEHLKGHTIVCGAGRTGEHIVAELVRTERDFCLIETDAERITTLYHRFGREFPSVVGDATEDDTLSAAGVVDAAGLVTCLSSEKDNLVVAFSARQLSPFLRIVARGDSAQAASKLQKAGAQVIVSPNRIGGLRMVSEVIRPTVASFLDTMLRDHDRNLRIEEVRIGRGSALDGTTIGELRAREIEGMVVMALRHVNASYTYGPKDSQELIAQDLIVFMGDPEARVALEGLTHAAT